MAFFALSSTVNVLLIGNYVHQQQPSMQRFATLLQDQLELAGVRVRLVQPLPVLGRLRPRATGLGKWLGYVDRLVLFPLALRSMLAKADVVHICDHGNAIYAPLLHERPLLVTCHDLFGAQVGLGEIAGQRTGLPGRKLVAAMLAGLAKVDHVACVSEETRSELLRLIPSIGARKTSVIHNGLGYPFSPMEAGQARAVLKAIGVTSEPFLLHVGGNQWYKNRRGALDIFRALRERPEHAALRLVLVGKPLDDATRAYLSRSGLEGSVLERAFVSNEELRALYSTAEALLFPSLREGFGWPIVEAQACGCPVFATGRAPMTAVGGDAAVYFDPDTPDAAADLIEEHLRDRAGMRDRGLRNARRFAPQPMAERYIELYKRMLADKG